MAELVTAKQNAIHDCTHIYLDAFDKKGPIGDLYSEAVAEYLERFIKTENCFMYTLIEKDAIVGFLTACEIPEYYQGISKLTRLPLHLNIKIKAMELL